MAIDNGEIKHVTDTALWVAVHRASEGERADALFKDPLAFVLAGERGKKIAKNMASPKIMAWIMAMRTVAIDALILEAVADGVDLVVNLGAGLDTRPYRMNLPASLKWIELDFPPMIQLKNERLHDETPGVALERIALDLSDRASAREIYKKIGASAKRILVITEGVIPYLTDKQASDLAEDLLAVPTFCYWIQDYRRSGFSGHMPKNWMKKKLKMAPFQFMAKDWFAFFEARGWKVKHDIPAMEESRRRMRPPPFGGFGGFLLLFMPKSRRDSIFADLGFVMWERK